MKEAGVGSNGRYLKLLLIRLSTKRGLAFVNPHDALLGIQSGGLPRHLYVWIDPEAVLAYPDGQSPLQAVWFGLQAISGRAWGCHCVLECGAVYRNLPLHQLRHCFDAVSGWSPGQAQEWDCYGERFSTLIYPYLDGLRCRAQVSRDEVWHPGNYGFTVAPVADAYTHQPEQAKEFIFIALDNGRFTAQPSDRVLFHDKSFTGAGIPQGGLRLQRETWKAEPGVGADSR